MLIFESIGKTYVNGLRLFSVRRNYREYDYDDFCYLIMDTANYTLFSLVHMSTCVLCSNNLTIDNSNFFEEN